MVSSSMDDLPMSTFNCVGTIAPVVSTVSSTLWVIRHSRIFPGNDNSEIGCQDLGILRSRLSFRIMMYVECFHLVGKWQSSIDLLNGLGSSCACVWYVVDNILMVIPWWPGADCLFAKQIE